MKHCVKEITGRIEYVTEYRGKTAQDIRDKMDKVMEARGEGLVIKHPLSKYVLNGRNSDWIKVLSFVSLSLTGQLTNLCKKKKKKNRLNRSTWSVERGVFCARTGLTPKSLYRITWARLWMCLSSVRAISPLSVQMWLTDLSRRCLGQWETRRWSLQTHLCGHGRSSARRRGRAQVSQLLIIMIFLNWR